MKLKKSTIFISLLLIVLIIFLIIAPEISISACLSGIEVWATNILPALFPFLLFTKLLGELGFITYISDFISPITEKLYNTSGISGYVYLMSIFSGYPVGAKITSDLVENKIIDNGQASRITTFTSTSGPLFVLGTVAIGMFNNKTLGYVVLLSHFVGALLNGLLYRKYKYTSPRNPKVTILTEQQKNILEDSMLSSIKSIMIVGGYISIFFMLITILNSFNIYTPILYITSKVLHIDPQIITAIINGIIELTRGCLDVQACHLSVKTSAMILSGLISFGGLSINLQAYTFLKKANINMKFYLLQKITHSLISIALAFIFGLIIL